MNFPFLGKKNISGFQYSQQRAREAGWWGVWSSLFKYSLNVPILSFNLILGFQCVCVPESESRFQRKQFFFWNRIIEIRLPPGEKGGDRYHGRCRQTPITDESFYLPPSPLSLSSMEQKFVSSWNKLDQELLQFGKSSPRQVMSRMKYKIL